MKTDSVFFNRLVFDSTITIGSITLPNNDGTAGQVLKTDGSGNVSWKNDSSITKLNELTDVVKLDANKLTISLNDSRILTLNSDVTINQSLSKTDSVSFNRLVLDNKIT